MEGEAPKSKRSTSHRRKLSRPGAQRAENDRSRGNEKNDDIVRQHASLFGIPNWSEVLDHLRSGPLQAIMLNDLHKIISYATEDLLFGFDCPSFLQVLSQLLQQPPCDYSCADVLSVQLDPNFQITCTDCINMILDIFPEEAKFFDSHPENFGFLTSKLAQLEYVDLGEKLLSIIDKISKEHPKALIISNAIPSMLEYIDFYPIPTQIVALEAISRALARVESISNYNEYVKPSLLPISQFFLHQNERIRETSLMCFKSLACNNLINDTSISIPYAIFQKMKQLLDAEIALTGKLSFINNFFENINIETMINSGDFKISKSVLDVVDIFSTLTSSLTNSFIVQIAKNSGLVESIGKLFNILVPRNYSATNLFALARLLVLLNNLIASTVNHSNHDQTLLKYFDKDIIKKLIIATKSTLIKSFDHINKWLSLDDCFDDFTKFQAVKLPINYLNKQIRLELVTKSETTRLLSRPFVPFGRIVSYILKNEQITLPFHLSILNSKLENPTILTICADGIKITLLEILIRVVKKRSIENIWQTLHILEVLPVSDKPNNNLTSCYVDDEMQRLLDKSEYNLDDEYKVFKSQMNELITQGIKVRLNENLDNLFNDKLVKDNIKALSTLSTQQIEMILIDELSDTAMLTPPPWITLIVKSRPEKFSLSFRRLLFYLQVPNLIRSLTYIQNIIKSSLGDNRLIVSNNENDSSITSALAAFEFRLMKHYHHTFTTSSGKINFNSDGWESRVCERMKVDLDRNKLLQGAVKAFRQIEFDTQPIVEFCLADENGIGTGPTLEVYNSILEKLMDLSETFVPLFSSSSVNGYFPSALERADGLDDNILPFFDTMIDDGGNYSRLLYGWWHFIGQLVACAMIDQRPLDLCLSPLFWSLVQTNASSMDLCDPVNETSISKYKSLFILSKLDYTMAKSLANLQNLSTNELDAYLSDRNHQNLDSYYSDTVSNHFEKYSVPIFAFRKGYSTILPLYSLSLFTADELSNWWKGNDIKFNIGEAKNYILTDHGYTQDSKPFIWLLEVLSEFSSEEMRLFLKFCTGSPILPQGGFKNLNPLMCVVKKPIESNQTRVLPSVMTCTNYLKLPDYPNKEMLKEMLLYAINEGQNEFELS